MSPAAAHAEDGTAYQVAGQGDCVVLVHGLGLDGRMWAAQVERLSAHREVVCVDLHGHGLSPPADPMTLAGLAAQVQAVLDHLGRAEAHVVGFGLGSWVAITLAVESPARVRSLVTISAAFRRLKSQADLLRNRLAQARRHGPGATADASIQRWFSAAFQAREPALVAAVRERIRSNDPDSYAAAAELALDADAEVVERARSVRCPALVLSGALDVAVPPATSRQLAAALGGARHQVIPRERHMMPIESPQLINDALSGWLDSLE